MASLLLALGSAHPAMAQTIYPIDRAEILAGARFDLKVELPGAPARADGVVVTINGSPAAEVLKGEVDYIANEDGSGHAALWIRNASIAVPGNYKVEARHGEARAEVRWDVFSTPAPTARNVILFIGDGLSNAHRVAARMLSKGIREGRYGGNLAMDDMPHMALVSTSGTDSIMTDSANSMSAYTTGHKSCTNAIAVYCARNKDNNAHPKVETIASIARRTRGKAVGIVTNTEIQDATPAAVVAHTRRRADYDAITRMLLDARPEVILGGGSAGFLPAPAGRRKDGVDYLKKFEEAGYKLAATATELAKVAAEPATRHLLGLFHPGNMDGALDRRILRKGTVDRFPDQPDLVDQMKAALTVLSRSDNGFVLVIESGMIDKYAHQLDWERSVYDTIMLDNAVAAAKAWAGDRNDTLIAVVGDHTHPASIIGTYDDTRPGATLRDKLGVYASAGFPSYPAPDKDGYPQHVDVQRRLAFVFAAYPDHCDAGKPYLAEPNRPTEPGTAPKTFVANEKGCQLPGAARRQGNLPFAAASGVHSGEDVILTASGPGADGFRGHIENTHVFRVLATALGLGQTR
ncbi:MAG: alkaline phosphatase [Hyphomicrobiaceae bacterium]|nr:alkaline phosphatase [Hyphomicrobiaceae bacterium]